MVHDGSKSLKGIPVLLLWLAVSAGAHGSDRVFPIPELTDEMLEEIRLDDGSVDEWFDLVGEPTMTLLDFQDPAGNPLPDPSELDFRIWLAWHDDPDRLYVAFVSSDDEYSNPHDYDPGSRLLEHDSIALAIDGDHRGGHGGVDNTITQEDWGDFHGQAQLYEAVARTVTGIPTLNAPDVLRHTGGFSWTVFPPYGEGGGGVAGENPTVSVIELYVTPYDYWEGWDSGPGETAFSELAAGKAIGFAVMVYDWDETTGSWRYFSALQTERPYTDMVDLRADVFLDGLLLPANPTDPAEETAVESVTWGRIKAALEME